MTSTDGVSIGEPRSRQDQTDLNERVTGEWTEREVAVQSVCSVIVPALAVRGCRRSKSDGCKLWTVGMMNCWKEAVAMGLQLQCFMLLLLRSDSDGGAESGEVL